MTYEGVPWCTCEGGEHAIDCPNVAHRALAHAIHDERRRRVRIALLLAAIYLASLVAVYLALRGGRP